MYNDILNLAEWFFDNNLHNRYTKQANSQKFSDEIWATLLINAIDSFNQGLEDKLDHEPKVASIDTIIDNIGENAFKNIAFLVIAQSVGRPIDTWAKASTIYTKALSNLQDQKFLFESSKQLYELSKTQGMDPEVAKNIASLAADLQIKADAATAQSGGGQIGGGGMSQGGMPTGLTIQGCKGILLKLAVKEDMSIEDLKWLINDTIQEESSLEIRDIQVR